MDGWMFVANAPLGFQNISNSYRLLTMNESVIWIAWLVSNWWKHHHHHRCFFISHFDSTLFLALKIIDKLSRMSKIWAIHMRCENKRFMHLLGKSFPSSFDDFKCIPDTKLTLKIRINCMHRTMSQSVVEHKKQIIPNLYFTHIYTKYNLFACEWASRYDMCVYQMEPIL